MFHQKKQDNDDTRVNDKTLRSNQSSVCFGLMLPRSSFKAVLFLTQQFFWVNQSFNAGDVKHHRQWTCVTVLSTCPLRDTTSVAVTKAKRTQQHYPFTLSGLETSDWQPTSTGVRSDLGGGKGDGGDTWCTQTAHLSPLTCHMSVSAEQVAPGCRLIRELYVKTVQSPNWTDGRFIYYNRAAAVLTCAHLWTRITPVVTLWLLYNMWHLLYSTYTGQNARSSAHKSNKEYNSHGVF